MKRSISFSTERFWFGINWQCFFLPACLCICFVSSSPKVNLERSNGIYTYSTWHLTKTFYQASLNLQSASFNL